MRKNIEMTKEQYGELLKAFYEYFKTGYEFEEFLKIYLEKIGLDEVIVTQRSRDGGVDLKARRSGVGRFSEADEIDYYIQAKRFAPTSTIPVSKIRELKGTIPFGHKGIFITTAKFSKDCEKESNNDSSKPVILVDGKRLVDSCIENEIGFVFVPKFSKVAMDRLTEKTVTKVEPQKETETVEKMISINDIRARILRIPRAIIEKIPETEKSFSVTFNNEYTKVLTIDKNRLYFGGVTEVYKKYKLIDDDQTFVPKKAIWYWEKETLNIFIDKDDD